MSHSPADMQAAIEAVGSGAMTLSEAARTFGMPRNTLWYRCQRAGVETRRRRYSLSERCREGALMVLDGSSYHAASKATGAGISAIHRAVQAHHTGRRPLK